MQALVFANGKLEYTLSHPQPKPADDEVLIAVELAGICTTDLEIIKGYMDFTGVPGHEFVGAVEKGPRDLTGKRVVAEINCVCGKCDMCHSGLSNHCRNRQVIGISGRDGAFAEYIVVPRRNVQVVPEAVSNETAIFVEPLAAAQQIVQQVSIEQRHKVVVVGDGRLGLLVVQVLAGIGAKGNVVLLGKNENKLTFAEKRGIQGVLLEDMLIKPEWDIVVDCTGTADGFQTACRLVRPRGKLILKSTFVPDKPVDLSPLVINEVTLIGSRCGPFPNAINALAAQQVVTNGLITASYKLQDGIQAFEKAKNPDQIKVVLEIKS
ncbi:MAG: alcohol dehydrogenase catalytic domain-containing protein [Sedimentisphaerales bacterium]|nr:alcohol dehydrogenase catalytic domain-containing protein [Sedimentisphaerales bacterium]